MQRRDVCGKQVGPERGALQRPPVPGRAGGDDNRVTAAAHRSVTGGHHQLDAFAAQRHISDLTRLDDQLTTVDRRIDRVGDRGRHPVPKHLPLPQILAQETALVFPSQRLPQPGGAGPHRVNHLSPVHTASGCVLEVGGERGAQLLERDPGRQPVEMGQLRRWTRGAEPTRKRTMPRQQGDGGASRREMQRDIYAGEPGADHQDAGRPRAPSASSAPGAHASSTILLSAPSASTGRRHAPASRACRFAGVRTRAPPRRPTD